MDTLQRPKVLVLDAQLRHSLAIVRSLGQKGIVVSGCSTDNLYPARYSRYQYSSMHIDIASTTKNNINEFKQKLMDAGISVLIPSGLPSNEFICKYADELKVAFAAPYNSLEIFHILSNKERTRKLAERIGIATPKTCVVQDPNQLEHILHELRFPLVFKSVVDQGTVRYAFTIDHLRSLVQEFWRMFPGLVSAKLLPIVQEKIEGDGFGFFGLYDHGSLQSFFMHKRIHEIPPSGGPSAMAESVYDQSLLDLGNRIPTLLKWNGVVMVEFKKSAIDGTFVLLEVNPKFWGSLDLAIASGVDFPYLLYLQLTGASTLDRDSRYTRNLRYRWISMDLSYSLKARKVPQFFKDFFRSDIRSDFSRTDPFPFLVLFIRGLSKHLRLSRK